MSTRSQLTKDLNESVKALLGKHVKILHKNVVKLETKGDKTENRVLVFSPCRLFLLTAKVPTKIESHFHYLEIQAVESKKSNQLCLTVGDKQYSFLTADDSDSHDVDSMIKALTTAVRNIFPTVPLQHIIRRIEVVPESRNQYLQDSPSDGRATAVGPCGGFSTQYACMCDYHNMPYREEVSWDVDTIYLSHDTRELCLRDFDHLDPKDIVPIISALEYNTWFTKLKASNMKLTHEALDRLLHILKKTLSLEELYLDNLGVKWDFAHKLSLALIANSNTPLHTLDLSNNLIEDKGASSLCGIIAKIMQGANHLSSPLGKLPKGLVHLNLSHCGLSSKGVNQLAHALSVNKLVPSTLSYLNLSGNNLKEEINNLCNFLAQPNSLTHLDLSGTDTVLESIFGALLRGCATNLVHLNVSRNMFSTKKTKEVPPSFKQFFTSTLSLKYLNMSFCKLPLEALKNLLLGLACNESTVDLELDLSCNNLGAQGAHVLESCVHGIRCISSLDISENNMDADLASVVTAISKNKSVKHLSMGRNLNNMKAKYIASVMDAVVQMIQEEDCVLQSLCIPDSKLKSDLYNLINALGSNQCLQMIDISGNMMGDNGARLLAKALQINSKLRTIIYDRNNITLQGYSDIAYALESNYTVRFMPFPIYDVVPCMKTSAERTDAVMKKIQDILHRNVTPKIYSNGQAFRLQQGFLLSSTQQMVDRLVIQTQNKIRALAQESTENNNDINQATGLIKDADNSKQLLTRLQEAVQCKEEAGNPIDIKLRQVSDELHAVIVEYLQNSLESMMKCAQEQCPHVLSDEHVRAEILKLCREKNRLSSDFVHSCVVERAGTEIVNRINELNLAVAARVSDRITDEVIESLSRSYKTLNINSYNSPSRAREPASPFPKKRQCPDSVGDTNEKRSSTPDVLRTRSRVSSGSSRNDPSDTFSTADTISQRSDQSPMKLEYLNLATPHLSTKRKSLHGRKLRPKSVVDSIEGLSADDIPDLLPPLPCSERESLDCGPLRLRHLVKGRPRRAKTRAPTRPVLRPSELTDIDGLGLSEGLDTFFRPGSTTPLVSPVSDDSSHTFPSDISPNRTPLIKDELNYHENKMSSSEIARNMRITPEMSRSLTEEDSRTEARLGRSSPLPKAVSGLLEPASASPQLAAGAAAQSQSTDSLERRSPLAGRRSQGDSPLTASPLALSRRLAQSSNAEQMCGVGQCVKEENDGTTQDGLENRSGIGGPYRSRAGTGPEVRKRTSSKQDVDAEKPPSPIVAPGVKLRSTGLVESLRSPTDSFPKGTTADGLKSPVLKSTTKDASLRTNDSTTCCGGKQCNSRQKPPPPIAPKPRPWSVVGGDRKSGEFSLLSDGSSTNTSAANTPDLDSGDTLDESTDSGVASLGSGGGCSAGTTVPEKRSVRELAASLDKQGSGGRTGSSHSTESENVSVSCMVGSEAALHCRNLTHLTQGSDGQSSTASKEVLESSVEDNGILERKIEIVASRKKRQSYVLNSQYAYDEDVIDV